MLNLVVVIFLVFVAVQLWNRLLVLEVLPSSTPEEFINHVFKIIIILLLLNESNPLYVFFFWLGLLSAPTASVP
jgi:hypothetical protein